MAVTNDESSMQDFIDNRWADAKIVLESGDASFVQTTEAYARLENALQLPRRPKPDTPLSDKWRKVIESTVDVCMAMKDLERCAELAGSVATPVTVHWFTQTYPEKAYDLVERTKTLVTNVCNAYGLGKLKDKYIDRLDSTDVIGNIGDRRHPMVHGGGGEGTLVERTITYEPYINW